VELIPYVCTTYLTTFGHVWVDSIVFLCLPLESEINRHDLLVGFICLCIHLLQYL
jgi:hypothetical protein